jgi:trimethylamine--corrinoid protein Co-methyltransferase
MSALMVGLAGANLIYGMGMLEGGQTWSHEQFMIDADIVRMVKHAIAGVDVSDETMSVHITKQAHVIKNFLHQKHTINHMREGAKPDLMDRTTLGTWETKGELDLTQKAREEACRILKSHQPDPLSDEAKKTIREILESTRKELSITS